jgi:hypothetical protein
VELHNLCPSGSIIKRDEMDGTCSTSGDIRSAYIILVGKPQRKRPLGKRGSRWKDNINIDMEGKCVKGWNI